MKDEIAQAVITSPSMLEWGREGGLLLLTKAGDIGTQLSSIRTEPIKELSMLSRAGAKDKGCYGNWNNTILVNIVYMLVM